MKQKLASYLLQFLEPEEVPTTPRPHRTYRKRSDPMVYVMGTFAGYASDFTY